MLTFETVNELTLKVTCTGNDVLFTKAGSFIAGENPNGKNYRFEKVLLGPQANLAQAALGSLMRRVTKENLPLMKVTMNGDSVTYYADYEQHVVVYQLAIGETVSVESENILAFTSDCKYDVRFIGCGVISQSHFHADRNRKPCVCCSPLKRQSDRFEQCPKQKYHFRRSGRRDLLDGTGNVLRPAGKNRHFLEKLYRSGIRRVVCL